jgi:hypothetical protein
MTDTESAAAVRATFREAVRAVEPLVAKWQASNDLELEARLGIFTYPGDGGAAYFDSTVPDNVERRVLDKFAQFKDWERIEEWRDIEDYFFEFQAPSLNGGLPCTVRSRTYLDSQTLSHVVEHTVKANSVRSSVVLRPCANVDSAGAAPCDYDSKDLLDIRVSLKSEEPISNSEELFRNVIVRPNHVRLQQRKVYWYGAWAFSLSRVWQGRTREQVEISQRIDVPRYEIECEVTRTAEPTQASAGQSSVAVALSLLMKMDDFQRSVPKVYRLESQM